MLSFSGILLFIICSCRKEAKVPTLTSSPVTDITTITAVSGAVITSEGSSPIIAKGVCWTKALSYSEINKTNDGSGSGSFTSHIDGLEPNTAYNIWAYATNSAGTGYGDFIGFITKETNNIMDIFFNPNLSYGSVADIEGNVYRTIQIGTQTWIAENLKVTKLNDGTSLKQVADNTEWRNLSTPGYSWYNNNDLFKMNYGALYNWNAVISGKLCPLGWHVPTDDEWTALITFLGGELVAGDKLKETGISHWLGYNLASNSSGFTALPGGSIFSLYQDVYLIGYWWSSTENSPTDAWCRSMWTSFGAVSRNNFDKNSGFSVRCIKD